MLQEFVGLVTFSQRSRRPSPHHRVRDALHSKTRPDRPAPAGPKDLPAGVHFAVAGVDDPGLPTDLSAIASAAAEALAKAGPASARPATTLSRKPPNAPLPTSRKGRLALKSRRSRANKPESRGPCPPDRNGILGFGAGKPDSVPPDRSGFGRHFSQAGLAASLSSEARFRGRRRMRHTRGYGTGRPAAYFALHRTGFFVPPASPPARWALTPPFHPHPP